MMFFSRRGNVGGASPYGDENRKQQPLQIKDLPLGRLTINGQVQSCVKLQLSIE